MDKNEEKLLLQSIGERLRSHRISIGLSQEEVSDLSGITQTQYNTIERGNTNFSIITITKIMKAFTGLSYDYLLANDNYSQQECIVILKNILKECPEEKLSILIELLKFAEKMVKS